MCYSTTKESPQTNNIDHLVEEYMPLAHGVASKHWYDGCDYPAIQSAAMLGLFKAAQRFDSSKGASFTTYAYKRINGEIKDYFRALLGRPSGQVRKTKLRAANFPHYHLEFQPEGYERETLANTIPDQKPDSEEQLFLQSLIPLAQSILSSKEFRVLELYYLDGLKQREIAPLMGPLTESRIHQIRKEALKKLRAFFKKLNHI